MPEWHILGMDGEKVDRKAVFGIVLALLLATMLTLAVKIQRAKSEPITVIVPDDYEKIQWAIGNATDGDTIYVKAGTYYENVFVNKSVSLIGQNKDNTIIDGTGFTVIDDVIIDSVILVLANRVAISNFTVRNGVTGILLRGDRCIVTDCVVYGNTMSGLAMVGSIKNVLRRNLFFSNTYNLHIDNFWRIDEFMHDIDTSNLVNGNPVYYLFNEENLSINPVTFPNIGYLGVVNSINVKIANLSITGNGQGLLIAFSQDTSIENIAATDNLFGISLSVSPRTTIRNCNLSYNYLGIHSYYSDNVTVRENTISHNDGGMFLMGSNYGAICRNNFIENYFFSQASLHDSYNCSWDDGYPSGGNFWSDYSGFDLYNGPYQNETGSDGIGDTPYAIDADNQDNYPLMNAWSRKHTHQLTVNSSLIMTFTINGAPKTTPYTEWLLEGFYTLEMPETHTGGEAKYCWNQWSDGNTSRSRTITMITNITLTAYYAGPYYELTVTSSPITDITFTINGTLETTPYAEWLFEDLYTLDMPESHNDYVWSHWLEDGDTNRTKTFVLTGDANWAVVFRFRADINGDDKVRVDDLLIAVEAFGTEPGHPRWNLLADLNGDNKVRIDDILTIALNFGRE